MNILIVGDDGPKSHGLNILIEFAKRQYGEAPRVILTNAAPSMGQGYAISPKDPKLLLNDLEELAPNRYQLKSPHPSDLIYLAMMQTKRFLRTGSFVLVLSGVNMGPNVGWDVMHSGTVAMGMIAASQFQTCSFCFSQDMPKSLRTSPVVKWPENGSMEEIPYYRGAEIYLPEVLNEYEVVAGECWNFNFPAISGEERAKGMVTTKVANYSNWPDRRDPSLPVTPNLDDDIQKLAQGYVTISQLDLRVNPILR